MNTFPLYIGTPEKIVFDGQAVSCSVGTPRGRIGFEARHEPFLSVLKENSEIRFTDGSGSERTLQIKTGLLAFRGNECSIVLE